MTQPSTLLSKSPINQSPRGGSPRIERLYAQIKRGLEGTPTYLEPLFRRLLRLLALPYCYFALVDWDQCEVSRVRVARDMLYIFFRLKYFPDNYSLCRLWEVDRSRWPLYYGSMYDPYQRRQLRRDVQKAEYQIVFADKEICHHLCTSLRLPVPRLLGRVMPGQDLTTPVNMALRASDSKAIVVKPVRGAGGRDVFVIEERNDVPMAFIGGEWIPVTQVVVTERSIIQERVEQHQVLTSIYSHALNTVRIQTLLTRDFDVLVLGAVARFGRNGSKVDNMSSGGIGVGVNISSGTLMASGRDFGSREYLSHPDTQVTFFDIALPFWGEVLSLVQNAQREFTYYRLVGFDIAITAAGPLIIEVNYGADNVLVEQCYGPILENEKVLIEFARYGLLINRQTKKLAAAAILKSGSQENHE